MRRRPAKAAKAGSGTTSHLMGADRGFAGAFGGPRRIAANACNLALHAVDPCAHAGFAAGWRNSGVMRKAVIRFFSRRSTRKRKPWKVKVWPGSGIERAS